MTTHVAVLDQSDIPASEYSLDFVFGSIKGALERDMSAKARDLWMPKIDQLDKIRVMDGLNVRVNDAGLQAHIRQIADSMKANGFKTSKPLEVFIVAEADGTSACYLADGHCRLAALRIALAEGADILNFPVVTLPVKGIGLQDIIAGLYTSNTGKSLTTFETALVCKRLAAFGWSAVQIGAKLGFGPEYIEQLLEVVSAPVTIVTMIQNGECSVGLALEMLRKHRGGAVEVLKAGLENAQRAGKKNVTKSYIAGASLEKVVKKQAKPLYDAAKLIVKDPAFKELSSDVQKVVEQLLAEIHDKEKLAEAKSKVLEAKVAEQEAGTKDPEAKQAS
ncbi:conserved hypothetical protein [Pseudomonas veronii]|uniref:hypothetical protein n=1 Tax=Pseudomonas veronii TaxID=76761 RepID=UPI0017637B67|nr:hypothetical protein [Pseudomonas veronii]CAD0264192.1 conserved hypothetical protein [Pseudomonas veronii]